MLRDIRCPRNIRRCFGGETATGGLIENYHGASVIDGYALMTNFWTQTDAYYVSVVNVVNENIVSMRRAGDLIDGAGDLKRTITSAALGAIAAIVAYEYVFEHGNRRGFHSTGYNLAVAD